MIYKIHKCLCSSVTFRNHWQLLSRLGVVMYMRKWNELTLFQLIISSLVYVIAWTNADLLSIGTINMIPVKFAFNSKHALSRKYGECNSASCLTRACMGCITPLRRPRSMYKNAVYWVEMAKWPWKSRSMTSIFNNIWENPRMHIWCKFGDSSSNLLQFIAQTSQIS